MIEDIRLSFKGIWSHKMRSFLTMLGIIVGIASVIAVVSTIKGTNDQIKNNLIGDGSNTIQIQLCQDGWPMDFTYNTPPDNIPVFDSDLKQELLDIDKAENVTFYTSRNWVDNMYYNNISLQSSTVYGIDNSYLSATGLQVVEGRGFSSRDRSDFSKVALVDRSLIPSLGGEDPIGTTIDINNHPFTIIGVVDKKSEFEPVINSIEEYYTYSSNSAGGVYIPQEVWCIPFAYDTPVNAVIKAATTDDMISVGNSAVAILNEKCAFGESSQIKYQASDLSSAAQQLSSLSSSTNILMIGIASISLLVGGIGVMNIMLVSVTERTREIGLKKALGARKRRIRRQFLTEAMILSGIGGILGVVTGIIMSRIISTIALIPVAISIPAVIIAVVFSMLIGIVFGIVPSIKASNLNPIDALRYE